MIWTALEAYMQEQIATGYGHAAHFYPPDGPLDFVIQILDFRPFTAYNGLVQACIDFDYPSKVIALALVGFGLVCALSQVLTRLAVIALYRRHDNQTSHQRRRVGFRRPLRNGLDGLDGLMAGRGLARSSAARGRPAACW
jgi:hypothetical protein